MAGIDVPNIVAAGAPGGPTHAVIPSSHGHVEAASGELHFAEAGVEIQQKMVWFDYR